MKADDRTMTLLTGIVLTVVVGMLAQNSDAIMTALSGEEKVEAADDTFTLRAGKTQTLDVLANDPAAAKAEGFRIVALPDCGTVRQTGGGFEYGDSGDCSGETTFIYCIELEGACEEATVSLNVIGAPAPRKAEPVIATVQPVAEPEPAIVQPKEPRVAVLPPGDTAPEEIADIRSAVLAALSRPAENTANPVSVPTQSPAALASLPDQEAQAVPAMTSVAPGIVPNLLTGTTAQIILPRTQDSLGTGIATASRTDGQEALQTDKMFATPTGAGQQQPAPLVVKTVTLLDAAEARLPFEPARPRIADTLCPTSLNLTATTGATIEAAVSSACRPGETITVTHAGMQFAAAMDASGKILLSLPAILADADVSVLFADGSEVTSTVNIPDMDRYLRVAVSWEGAAKLELHALEFGANPGDQGHIWTGAARSYREARRFGGGYLTGLGTGPGLRAEVYTLPLIRRTDGGLVEMSLALAGGARCDDILSLRAVRSDTGTGVSLRDLQFRVTDCGLGSEPVFIANALEDLRVASRR